MAEDNNEVLKKESKKRIRLFNRRWSSKKVSRIKR